MNREKILSTCRGIRLYYNSTKAGIDNQLQAREKFVQQARDLRTQIKEAEKANHEATKNYLKRELNRTVQQLSNIDKQIGSSHQKLQDLLNDYNYHQCNIHTGSID